MNRNMIINIFAAVSFLGGLISIILISDNFPQMVVNETSLKVYEYVSAVEAEVYSPKVNINKANVQELMQLEGIGEKRANDIIKYREEHGRFTSRQDIMKVSGIGEKTYELIKNDISVS